MIIAGWVIAVVEVLLFFLMYQAELDLELFMYIGLLVMAIALVLLVKTIRSN